MPYLIIALVFTTGLCGALAAHYHDLATKYRAVSEELCDMLNGVLLNEMADTLERQRVS